MTKRDAGRTVKIRGQRTGEDYTLALKQADFTFLKRIADSRVQIKHCEKDYRRMLNMGLVTHEFDQTQGWPIALAKLTTEGRQALAQEYAPSAS